MAILLNLVKKNENVNVEGHVAIANGNSGEGDISTCSLLGCNSAHIR